MQAAATSTRNTEVHVSLTITDETGATQVKDEVIAGGPTRVPDLKSAFEEPVESALWVVQRNGKKKQLGDHETHNVKEGDRYEALVRGGVS